ncbi:MAG: hypothetical protein HOP07_09400 [Bacteriovoracaceae bacterium]|nr:hypothetical protein [Bacteriovoracaceae bacterium]
MNNDDLLMSKLIAETYSESTDKDQPNAVGELRSYFEKKLNAVEFISLKDYVEQNNLKMNPISFQENTKCYRLNINSKILDFPSNWSIFKQINTEDIVYIDQSLDQDFLLDIFAEINGQFFNILFVKDSINVKIVYLPEDSSREHLQWFRGFVEKKNQDSEQVELDSKKDAA